MSNKATNNAPEVRYVNSEVKVEKRMEGDVPMELGVVEGYAAKYNQETVIGGWFKEVIRPGFFDDVLNDDVRCLKNHDANYILARSVEGEGTLELILDEVGLRYRYTTPDITYARDLQVSMERGDITQSSFSFIPEQVNWIEKEGEMEVRELIKCKELFDVSPVTYPAYKDTTVGKRSWEARQAEKNTQKTEDKIQTNGDNSVKTLALHEARHIITVNKSK